MPIVQKLTLRETIGDIPKGTQIMIVTKTKKDRSTYGYKHQIIHKLKI